MTVRIDPAKIPEATREFLVQAGWTPPPRVWLEGDDVPSHVPVIDSYGEVRDDYRDYDAADGDVYTANYDVVEMNIDYEAAITRAKEARK